MLFYTSHSQILDKVNYLSISLILVRAKGFEPLPSVWKTSMLAVKHQARTEIIKDSPDTRLAAFGLAPRMYPIYR